MQVYLALVALAATVSAYITARSGEYSSTSWQDLSNRVKASRRDSAQARRTDTLLRTRWYEGVEISITELARRDLVPELVQKSPYSHRESLQPATLLEKPSQYKQLSEEEKAQKKAAGASKATERQKLRDHNAHGQVRYQGSSLAQKYRSDVAKPDPGHRRQPGLTRADIQDMDKPSTGRNKDNRGGTIHAYSQPADDFIKQQPAQEDIMKADAERVVGEALRHPQDPITHGQGPSAANTVIRARIHTTGSTLMNAGLMHAPGQPQHNDVHAVGATGQQMVVSIQQAAAGPRAGNTLARHLPVIYNPTTGEAHYDPRQQEAIYPNKNKGITAVPSIKKFNGPAFYPRRRRSLNVRRRTVYI